MSTGERVVTGFLCGIVALGLYMAAAVSAWSSTGAWHTNLGEIISALQENGVTLFFWIILAATIAAVIGLIVLVVKLILSGRIHLLSVLAVNIWSLMVIFPER